MDIKALREEVNPVYMTARGCLQTMAANGNQEAIELLKRLKFKPLGESSKEVLPPALIGAVMKYIAAISSANEGRFGATNGYLLKNGAKQVLDLPCGYTTRGLTMSAKGIQYYGADLPAVTDDIGPAAESMADEEQKKFMHYKAADATNYESLRSVLEGASGELAITTEGLLMYLSDSELTAFFENIRRLLSEFGGYWITMDPGMYSAGNKIAEMALKGEPLDAATVTQLTAGRSSNNEMYNNFIYKNSIEKAIELLSARGFEIEQVPMFEYMPELLALKNLPEEKKQGILDIYKDVCFWVARPAKAAEKSFSNNVEELGFKAEAEAAGGRLKVTLSGRLDTLTSPNLLGLFREAEEAEDLTAITIDAEKLTYVSSAGLRVLLIMYKALPGENKDYKLQNVSDDVNEILETTGFSDLFG